MENYNSNKKQSFSQGADIEPNIEFFTHSAVNPIYDQHPSALMSLPLQNQDLPAALFIHHHMNNNNSNIILSHSHSHDHHIDHAQTKRKEMEISSSSPTSSPQLSADNGTRSKNSIGRGKQAKRDENKEGKEAEVVHVRAKRGQATDSHSLAERVRREKINERLRCLQDIVPGCYKTMGMAVMLDEIINYVQSLQNQVEFLSMKLTAASSFHDFSSEADDAMETMQRAKTYEASKMHNGTPPSQFPPLNYNFEYCPQFPHNK